MRMTEIEANKKSMIADFMRWAKKQLGIKDSMKIVLSNNLKRVKEKRTFGTTYSSGEIWVYIGNRNTADILRTLCHEMVHFKQFAVGTAHDDMDEKQRLKVEDEANAIAGRMMREYGKQHEKIYESKSGSLQDEVAEALPATFAIPELQNNDPYLQYRFGVAMAGAKGAAKRKQDNVKEFSRETPWGENAIVVSFDPNIETYIDDALSQMGLKGKRLISTRKSEEAKDVNAKSPVSNFRGYNK